jgi:glycine betaine/proline transport system substrate-binding protein
MSPLKSFAAGLLGAAAGLSLACSVAFAEAESPDPVKLAFSDWTTIQLNTEIASRILQKMGYNTELVPSEYLAQIGAIEEGDIHASLEVWFTTAGPQFNGAVASGKAIDLGETGMQAIEEWWYPSYMKEQCPGLPDWKALNDCAKLFATAETGEKGKYIAGPQSWGGFDKERVEALGLNWEVVYAGNDATLNAEIKSAYERKAPVMAWVYAPNWTTNVYEGEWIAFPGYTDECYNDPKWGTNPDKTHDCGKPRGPIKKLGNKEAAAKYPKAFAMLGKFAMTNDVINGMAKEVDVDGKAVADVAQAWVDANEAVWKPWTE